MNKGLKDKPSSMPSTESFRDNYDRIFKKKCYECKTELTSKDEDYVKFYHPTCNKCMDL